VNTPATTAGCGSDPKRTNPRIVPEVGRLETPKSYCLDSRIQTNENSKIRRGEACALRNTRQHTRADLLGVVKGEDEIRPTSAFERSMGTGLPLDFPADP
jgi:hypothetical protein